jgi:enolase
MYWLYRLDDDTFDVTTTDRLGQEGPFTTEVAAHERALELLKQSREQIGSAIKETRRRIRACG